MKNTRLGLGFLNPHVPYRYGPQYRQNVINQLWRETKGHCVYCNRRLAIIALDQRESLTRDHLIPISANGPDAPWNLVAACQDCNVRRGARWCPVKLGHDRFYRLIRDKWALARLRDTQKHKRYSANV